jgi:Domain of unknown function (DUF4386)
MVPRNGSDGLIRVGVLALPLAGLLALVGLYSSFQLGTGGILATGDNRAIVSSSYFVSELVGNALALTLLIFGVVALYAYLANSSVRALALGAMVLSIFGIALQLTQLGVFAYAIPALSRSFLNGHQESIRILDYIFSGPFRIVVTLALLLYLAGFILWGVAIWRSGVLPKWAGVLVALHAPLLIYGPVSVVGPVVGALLALVGGGWIALSVMRRSPPAQMRAEAEPRVR